MTPAERFWIKVDRNGPRFGRRGRCWLWTAASQAGGYGRFWDGTSRVLAHVWSWTQEHGPVPEGCEIDHVCRRTNCVRPSHLEAVTHEENIRRGDRPAMGAPNRKKTHCPSGHRYDKKNTRHVAGRRQCRKCDNRKVRSR